ncbi:succinylglutamate desuccinylase/aspartoacylase family protein [Candidatus Gottesmanbacteria bacterium]|nr:succinylglutamate desuccinylase/aspartoacylase family protein [Candidatus Gottesmanbacteria bacterium]
MNASLELEKVNLGEKTISIPIARIRGKLSGHTLLVTAGMDGDEYAAVDAAYKVWEKYKGGNFSGTLLVVPIVNIPGFETGTSYNPLDGKFPKHIFPGKPTGSPSERLIYWLYQKILSGVSVWLDLHGASVYERLSPVLLMYETENREVNERNIKILHALPKGIITYERPGVWGGKPVKVGSLGISYIMAESGDLGARDNKWVNLHLRWVESVMKSLGMKKGRINNSKKNVYREIHEEFASQNGLWYPTIEGRGKFKKNTILGEIRSLTGDCVHRYIAKRDGQFLWGLEKTYCRKGEEFLSYGSELAEI